MNEKIILILLGPEKHPSRLFLGPDTARCKKEKKNFFRPKMYVFAFWALRPRFNRGHTAHWGHLAGLREVFGPNGPQLTPTSPYLGLSSKKKKRRKPLYAKKILAQSVREVLRGAKPRVFK